MAIPPQQALYINNLNDKIQKEELRRSLYLLFSQYGPVMDIVATKVWRMRGQAFIVFKDVNAATTALRQLQGLFFFDKPMRIQYAKSKSDVVARIDGSYSAKRKRERKEKERQLEREREQLKQQRKDAAIMDRTDRDVKRRRQEEEQRERERERDRDRARRKQEEQEEPHSILFVENLPPEATENPQMLAVLFQNFEGFREVRLPPGKTPIAFVEFDTPQHAREARSGLQGFAITYQHSMQISYAKKG
eukprot:TRINITY_DN19552_c0_g1_i1.p1 TRINITY_DN19552_c0_g1~~TRINITY_DN19552_c0_g1_i1.p1  ORF type:complete len:248 (+),score=92.97 TRINITY_DN19552_c0_g1_i1:53-796(+)